MKRKEKKKLNKYAYLLQISHQSLWIARYVDNVVVVGSENSSVGIEAASRRVHQKTLEIIPTHKRI